VLAEAVKQEEGMAQAPGGFGYDAFSQRLERLIRGIDAGDGTGRF
jgi:hypothetical protein